MIPGAYQPARWPLLGGVKVMDRSETRPFVVGSQRTVDNNGESVWSQAATQFRYWRAGEAAALDDLVRTLSPVLWHVVRAYGLEREQAEDVVQTTWLTLVRRHESIADPQAVASWMITAARREAWRLAKTAARSTPVIDEVIERRVPVQRPADVDVVEADEHSVLWHCVHELDERCQRLMRIVAFDDRPDYAGIAKDMDMPIGSIGPTRGRCLRKLKALLSKAGVDHGEQ
jgi:RNA polymerase sigma factor (sigma-70 family)